MKGKQMRLALSVCVAAMSTVGSAVASQTAELAGSQWRPVELGERSLPQQTQIFVQFDGDNRLSGHSGCNSFFGSYKISGPDIEIRPIGATRMACSERVTELETAFFAALDAAQGFRRDGPKLVLFDRKGRTIARLAQRDRN
jgi:heat shock protein HslJ